MGKKESDSYRINCSFGINDPLKKQAYDTIQLFGFHKSDFLSIVIDFYLQSLNLECPVDSKEAADIIMADIKVKTFARLKPDEYARMLCAMKASYNRSKKEPHEKSFTVNDFPDSSIGTSSHSSVQNRNDENIISTESFGSNYGSSLEKKPQGQKIIRKDPDVYYPEENNQDKMPMDVMTAMGQW